MYATVRRYEGIDQSRKDELTSKVEAELMPRLSKLPGFGRYYLIEGKGVMTSVSVFDTSTQGEESSRIAADWLRDEKLDSALPNEPKITGGEIIAQLTREKAPVA